MSVGSWRASTGLGLARTPTAPMAKKAVTMREKIIVKSNSRLKTLGKSSLRVLLAGFQSDFVAGFYTVLIPQESFI